jgi:hypothetical protein
MNVLALQVLYDLGFDGFGVGQLDDAYWDGIEFRNSRGPETPCSRHDLVLAWLQFPHQKRRENSLRFETGGQFLKTLVVKSLAGITGRLNQRRYWDAAIFMGIGCTLRIRHFLFSFDFVFCRFVMDSADFWRDCEM